MCAEHHNERITQIWFQLTLKSNIIFFHLLPTHEKYETWDNLQVCLEEHRWVLNKHKLRKACADFTPVWKCMHSATVLALSPKFKIYRKSDLKVKVCVLFFLYNFYAWHFCFDEHSGLQPTYTEKHTHVFTQGVHHICHILPKLEHVGKVSKNGWYQIWWNTV